MSRGIQFSKSRRRRKTASLYKGAKLRVWSKKDSPRRHEGAWFKNTGFVVTVSTDLAAIGYDGFAGDGIDRTRRFNYG